MAKGVILKTNEGIKLMGTTQCSNGSWWTATNCFKYCNAESMSDYDNKHQAFKLTASAASLNVRQTADVEWYKNRDNFIDVEITYELDQTYSYAEM